MRNNYAQLLEGRSRAQVIFGAERVFGFGSGRVSDQPFAELLTEMVRHGDEWLLGSPHVLLDGSDRPSPTSQIMNWHLDRSSPQAALLIRENIKTLD